MTQPTDSDLSAWRQLSAKLGAAALYTPAEAAASFAALKTLEQAQVPWYEQAAITDVLLNAIVATVLTAAAQARAKENQP
jgi:hypothetical protein